MLLGAKPEATLDKTEEQKQTIAARDQQRRERVAAAGGEMLGAVFQFLGELVESGKPRPHPTKLISSVRNRLTDCVEEDAEGRQRLTISLPNRQSLDHLAQTLARLLVSGDTHRHQTRRAKRVDRLSEVMRFRAGSAIVSGL